MKNATFAQHLAQVRQASYNSKRYTPPRYKVGDMVYLSRKLFTDASSAVRPSHKLCLRNIGALKIEKDINKNVVHIILPPNIKIHPVIHVEHTLRAFNQPEKIVPSGAAAS